MKLRDIKQENKSGPNIVGDNIKIGNLVTVNKEDQKGKERIPVDNNRDLHNLSLWLYGFLFKKFGFLKTGIGFVISGLISAGYLYQTFLLKLFQNNYLTVLFIALLVYSVNYFQFFKNRSCPECKSQFSLIKKGTFKVGECKIKGIPHDINETEFECEECHKSFVESFREEHDEQ